MSKVAREYLRLDARGRLWTHLVCREGLTKRWKGGIARRWARQHKHLFDSEDTALAQSQSGYHFVEWVAAIHFGQTRRVRAAVCKWKTRVPGGRGGFKRKHLLKAARVRKLLGEHRYITICRRLQGAGPDLFLYNHFSRRYWFVEVKKVGDRLSARQQRDARMIEKLLRVPVQLVRVHPR